MIKKAVKMCLPNETEHSPKSGISNRFCDFREKLKGYLKRQMKL